MICECAYYSDDKPRKKIRCGSDLNPKDDIFEDRCPWVYYCPISEQMENTEDYFDCVYRVKKND